MTGLIQTRIPGRTIIVTGLVLCFGEFDSDYGNE